jgi:phospholipid N-methyltransferase
LIVSNGFFMTLNAADAVASKRAAPPRPWLMFFKGFLANPVMVGSVIPSTKTLIRHMLRPVDWPSVKLFVEYGPGVGTFCQEILDRLPADATYIAIDTNPEFISYLSRHFTDQRFRPILGSAADVATIVRDSGFDHADYVLSGLPFSTLPEGVGPTIAKETFGILRPGGAFLVYQFRAKAKDYLMPFAKRIDQAMEYWNIPPCWLFWAWKD